jgi:RNA polymerase sigma-70 factor (ECF subfamily)
MDRSDAELVDSLRRGDRAAFEALYDRHQEWVASLAFRFTRHREDALDVLQETFAYLFRKAPTLELRSQLRTFLYPVVKHLALDRLRRREVPLHPGVNPAAPEAATDETASLLAGLSEEQKEVVLLRFVDGLDLESIAETLEIPLGTVKSRLHCSIEILRRRAPNR